MKTINWNLRFLLYVIVLQVIVFLAIVLNIPFVRQVLVALYLLLIPGFVLLRVLKIETSNMTETLLFSIGLSIVFVMLIGLLLNSLGFISQPLSTTPLIITINVFVLFISVLSFLNTRKELIPSVPFDIKISPLIPYLVLPFLSLIGMLLVRTSSNNFLLILIILIVALLLALASFSKIPVCHYPVVIVSISVTLLLMTFLTSNYLNGFDVHFEYVVFSATKNASSWNPSIGLNIANPYAWMYFYVSNAMLGSTILPTALSNMANIAGTQIFNILYPLIFSLVPLALYQFLQEQWGKKVAFLAVLFFISNSVFFEFRNNSRQMLAEFFFVLLFLVFFKKNTNDRNKWLLIPFFGFGLLASYYTLNYAFLILILLTWLCTEIFSKHKPRNIPLAAGFFLLISTLVWYMYVNWGPFDRFTFALSANIDSIINDFFSFETRTGEVIYAADLAASPTFFHLISRIFFYASMVLILIGFIAFIIRRNKESHGSEYRILTYINMFALSLVIFIPRFAAEMQLTKWYHTTLIFLSPLYVLGGVVLFKNLLRVFALNNKKREHYGFMMIAMVMVPFFLFQTGFVYETLGVSPPSSISLSGYRMDDLMRLQYNLINENDFFGASWLSKYTLANDRKVYSDVKTLDNVLWITLMDYDMASRILSNLTVISAETSYIFLSDYNTKTGILLHKIIPPNVTYNISEIPILDANNKHQNKIYANGASQIHYCRMP